jgi:hypothetical protein
MRLFDWVRSLFQPRAPLNFSSGPNLSEIEGLGPNQMAYIQALESGQFRQTTARLCEKDHNGLKYCVLGVACVVGGLEPRPHGRHSDMAFEDIGYIATLPPKIEEFFAFHDTRGTDMGTKDLLDLDQMTLIKMNDRHRMTFRQIAHAIRKNPSHFFKEPK